MTKKEMNGLTAFFESMHKHPPAPFNKSFDPKAKSNFDKAVELCEAEESMRVGQVWSREYRASRLAHILKTIKD